MEQRSDTVPNVGDTTISMENVDDYLHSAIMNHLTQSTNTQLVTKKRHHKNAKATSAL